MCLKLFSKKKKTNISLHYTSISRLVNRPMGVSKILSEGPRGKSFFLNSGKVLSAFLPELTFALMVQKQWWVKLLAPWHKSRRCHETVGEGCSHHHHTLTVKKGNPVFLNVFVKQQQQFHCILTFSSILCDRMGSMK